MMSIINKQINMREATMFKGTSEKNPSASKSTVSHVSGFQSGNILDTFHFALKMFHIKRPEGKPGT